MQLFLYKAIVFVALGVNGCELLCLNDEVSVAAR